MGISGMKEVHQRGWEIIFIDREHNSMNNRLKKFSRKLHE